jgi:hypothetical protein
MAVAKLTRRTDIANMIHIKRFEPAFPALPLAANFRATREFA